MFYIASEMDAFLKSHNQDAPIIVYRYIYMYIFVFYFMKIICYDNININK